jgi:uncharacterized protein (TIGR02594 family)
MLDASADPALPIDAPAEFDPAALPWLAEARRVMVEDGPGLREEGERLHLLGRLNRRTPWTLPWCGLFVAHCLRTALPELEPPRWHARARPWRRWGEETTPRLGAVMLFWHYHPALPFGHVAFYWAEDRDAFHVLGGNQRHRVCVQRYPKSRLVAARWPHGVPRAGARRREPPEAALPFG